jgi:hypothetical protein
MAEKAYKFLDENTVTKEQAKMSLGIH